MRFIIRIVLVWGLFISFGNTYAQEIDSTEILIFGTTHDLSEFSYSEFESIRGKLLAFEASHIFVEFPPPYDTLSLKQAWSYNFKQSTEFVSDSEFNPKDTLESSQELWSANLADFSGDLISRSLLAKSSFAKRDYANAYYHWFITRELMKRDDIEYDSVSLYNTFPDSNIQWHFARGKANSEYGKIIFPVAFYSGIPRLISFDDRSDDARFNTLTKKAMWRLVLNLKVFKVLKIRKRILRKMDSLNGEELFTYLNSREFTEEVFTLLNTAHPKLSKGKKMRQLKELWIERNQAMAKRINAGLYTYKSRKAVVVVGAAHVKFLGAYLKEINSGLKITYWYDLE